MKFLLDVCVSSRSLEASLVRQGHDVLSAVAIDPKASDEWLLALALADERGWRAGQVRLPTEASPPMECYWFVGVIHPPFRDETWACGEKGTGAD